MGKKKTKRNNIRIQMDTKHEDFDAKKKKDFKKELKSVTNNEQIGKPKFERGCVLFSGILDKASGDHLIRVFLNKENKKHHDSDIDTLKFIKKYSISDIVWLKY